MAKRAERGLPFEGLVPIPEEDMQSWVGELYDAVERVDGPAPPGSANTSSGGVRRFKSDPEKRSDIRILSAFIGCPEIWELADELEEIYSDPGRPGPPRGYNFMDILVAEAAVFLHVSRYHAQRNLDDEEFYWAPLRKAAEKRFPQHRHPNWESRRLSPTAPSRSQVYRARSQYLVGEALEKFRRSCRRGILQVVRECGLLDPDAGKWTRPARSQIVVADKTHMHAATRRHRDDPLEPPDAAADQRPEMCGKTVKATNKPCRLIGGHRGNCRSIIKRRHCDHNANYFRLNNNTLSTVPGRELIIASVRGDDPNVRFLLDAEFMRPNHDPERVTESTQAVNMLRRLIEENSTDDDDDLVAGIRGFGYDMALSPKAIDDVLDLRRVPVVKVPRLKGNRYRSQSLGLHTFTTRGGGEEELSVQTLHGAPWLWLPSGDKLQAVPLKRRKMQWGTQGKQRSILYMHASIPTDDDVPEPLQGATTLIRVNSTKEEIANNPHTRRSLSLRAIPEADPHFPEIFGAREDIESTFSNLKYLTRGKLKSIYEDRNLFALAAYMLLWMSRARAAYYKSVAANPTQAIPIAA